MEEIKLQYAEIIADLTNEAENIRTRVLRYNNKLYLHQMKSGSVIYCKEIKL